MAIPITIVYILWIPLKWQLSLKEHKSKNQTNKRNSRWGKAGIQIFKGITQHRAGEVQDTRRSVFLKIGMQGELRAWRVTELSFFLSGAARCPSLPLPHATQPRIFPHASISGDWRAPVKGWIPPDQAQGRKITECWRRGRLFSREPLRTWRRPREGDVQVRSVPPPETVTQAATIHKIFQLEWPHLTIH